MNLSNTSNDVTTTTTLLRFNTSMEDGLGRCHPVFPAQFIGYAVMIFIEVLWNLLIMLAILLSRNKLKQNRVYSYVTNVVAANIAFGVLMFYTFLAFLVPFETSSGNSNGLIYDESDPPQVHIMHWWAFRKALMIGMFLIMSLSVVVLIQGIADSAYFVGRTGDIEQSSTFDPSSSASNINNKKKFRLTRKQQAVCRISVIWLIPIVYSMISLVWNCSNDCHCLPAYYKQQDDCITEQNVAKCSVWTPMTKGHMLLANVIWIFQSGAIFVSLYKTAKKYRSTMKPTKTTTAVAQLANDASSKSGQSHSVATSNSSNNLLKVKVPLHPTIKLLIALSVSYTVCTAPLMACFGIDAVTKNLYLVSDLAVTVSAGLVFLYCYICPAFLIAYMPGLKSAIVGLLLSCPCTTTTVSGKKTRTISMR